MTKEAPPKSLKDHNRVPLWTTIAVNLVALYGFSQYEAVSTSGLKGMLAGATGLVPMALALVATTLANGFLSAETKAGLVFLRRRHALPGHRAFSEFAVKDSRIDIEALRKLLGKDWPTTPDAENRIWYRLFKETENDPVILWAHREFLFTRDYAGFAALFLVTFGPAAAFTVRPPSVLALYLACLALQFFVVRQAAATYGNRLVCTVLARRGAAPVKTTVAKGNRKAKGAPSETAS
ncbi:hypothetical protein [Methylorubrum populi]|uniref:Glycosyl-4,4'-diaponeurosporenoate acyltransferase n=1 Tax=Methylorubrum populi TaxID=223967 RepID=A0A833MZM9_9HYPH|nr:hypothetical protein [Methylorubrum populi]KAB7783913.1 hypothetical protein F8B43_3836 [Methylorubrum populi]